MNANQKYIETRLQIEKEIEILKQKLESMDMDQKKDNKNYGYVGDADYLLNAIQEINYNSFNYCDLHSFASV